METRDTKSNDVTEACATEVCDTETSTALTVDLVEEVAVAKHPGGRPTKYEPRYCELVDQLMSGGLSKEAVAGEIGIHKDTLYGWIKAHPEFSDAVKIGEMKSQNYWERLGRLGANGGIKNFSAASWIFNMKNRFSWRDRVEVSADPENPTTFVGLIVEAERILAAVKKKSE